MRATTDFLELRNRDYAVVAGCIEIVKLVLRYFDRLVSVLLRKHMGKSEEQVCIY